MIATLNSPGRCLKIIDTLRPASARSLVSGGAGPALVLSLEVLGIKSVGPGFQECRIEVPKLETVHWAKGVFPSVMGDIQVEWRKEGRKLNLVVDLPSNLSTTLVIWPDSHNITHNMKPVKTQLIHVMGGKHQLVWE